jgi:hypothetical protein
MLDIGCASKLDIHSLRRSKRSGERKGERCRDPFGEDGTKGVSGCGASSSSSSSFKGINLAELESTFYLVFEELWTGMVYLVIPGLEKALV